MKASCALDSDKVLVKVMVQTYNFLLYPFLD